MRTKSVTIVHNSCNHSSPCAVTSVCTMFLHASVSGYLQKKRGGKPPNNVIDSPPSPQPLLALEILSWMMVCVHVQGEE